MWPGKVIAAEHVNAAWAGEQASQSHCWRASSRLHAAWAALLRLLAWARDSLRMTETRALLAVCAGALLLHLWPLQALSTNYDEGMYWSSLRAMVAGFARYNPHLPLPAACLPGQRLSALPALRPDVACRAHRHSALCARRHCGRLFRRARAGRTLGGRGDGGAAGAQSALPGDDAHLAAGRARARAWGWSGWPARWRLQRRRASGVAGWRWRAGSRSVWRRLPPLRRR